LYKAVSWLPLAALVAAYWDVSRHEGWGAWAAAAGLAPLVFGFSAVMGLTGMVLWIREWRRGRRTFTLLMAALLAGSVSIWFLAKMLYMELARSF
jgi:hypothetical protein